MRLVFICPKEVNNFNYSVIKYMSERNDTAGFEIPIIEGWVDKEDHFQTSGFGQ